MTSDNKTVMRVISILVERRDKIQEHQQTLRQLVDEKYPYDMYGLKGEMIFQERSEKYKNEIRLINKYISGMYDLIEIIEGKERK